MIHVELLNKIGKGREVELENSLFRYQQTADESKEPLNMHRRS